MMTLDRAKNDQNYHKDTVKRCTLILLSCVLKGLNDNLVVKVGYF